MCNLRSIKDPQELIHKLEKTGPFDEGKFRKLAVQFIQIVPKTILDSLDERSKKAIELAESSPITGKSRNYVEGYTQSENVTYDIISTANCVASAIYSFNHGDIYSAIYYVAYAAHCSSKTADYDNKSNSICENSYAAYKEAYLHARSKGSPVFSDRDFKTELKQCEIIREMFSL